MCDVERTLTPEQLRKMNWDALKGITVMLGAMYVVSKAAEYWGKERSK